MSNTGKNFEQKFKEDWETVYGFDGLAYRLHDQMTGYKVTSQNPCDFICYAYPYLYLVECKSHLGNTFPFSALRQYDKLIEYPGKKGVRAGVLIWFIDHDSVVYVPVAVIKKMKEDGKKSVHINDASNGVYKILTIPSVKKRVYMDSDYSVLATLVDGD